MSIIWCDRFYSNYRTTFSERLRERVTKNSKRKKLVDVSFEGCYFEMFLIQCLFFATLLYSTKDITDHILLCTWPQQFINLLFCFSTVVVAIVGATPIQGCLFQWAKTRPSLCYQVSSSVFIFLLILQWQQLVGQKVDLSVSLFFG